MENNKKKIKLFACVFMLIGGMFGSAIFSLSGITILEAGPSAIISWIVAGVIMLVYGLLVSELAAYFPESGGVYVFPAKAIKGKLGEFWGWISCWSSIIVNIAAISFSAIFIGVYLSVSFEWAANLQIPIALAAIVFVLLVNIIKFKNMSKVNSFLVFVLIAIMLVFVIFVFADPFFDTTALVPFFDQGQEGSLAWISSIPVAIVAYSAVTAIAFMAKEVHKPNKTIPRACILSIIFISLLYALILFATVGIVSVDYLAQNPDMQMIPLFVACQNMINGNILAPFLSIAATIALLTTMLVVTSFSVRTLQVAANDKIIPRVFAKNNKAEQPFVAVIATLFVSGIICCFPAVVSEIVDLGVLFNVITISIVVVSVFFARKHEKLPADAFKLKGGNFWPILFLLILFACNVVDIATSNYVAIAIFTFILLLVGILIFFISKRK